MADTTTATANPSSSNGKTGLTDSIKTAFGGDAPLTEKVKGFYKAKPAAAIALAAVAGIAIFNTVRGRS
jgi:hypothetical protein